MCRGGGHVTFCNMLHCCIAFCWLCRRPNVTLPQMNCHVQWFTVIKKRKFVALPWHCLYLDGEEQKKRQKDGNYWPKVRWRHATASAPVRVNLESCCSDPNPFWHWGHRHQPLNIRIVVMRTNEMWDEDDRKMIQIKTIRQCHENTMRRYK